MKCFTRFGWCLAGLLSCCVITQADPITFTFTNINVPGGTNTVLNSINNVGQIVGTYTDSTGQQRGFLDTNGVFTTLPFMPTDINNVGQIVGLSSNGIILDTNGVITTINVPGNFGFAQGIGYHKVGLNDLGQIVGTTLLGSPLMASQPFCIPTVNFHLFQREATWTAALPTTSTTPGRLPCRKPHLLVAFSALMCT